MAHAFETAEDDDFAEALGQGGDGAAQPGEVVRIGGALVGTRGGGDEGLVRAGLKGPAPVPRAAMDLRPQKLTTAGVATSFCAFAT